MSLAGPAVARPRTQEPIAVGEETAGEEERFARQVCTPCHAMPPPDSLPRSAWREIVWEMKGLALQGVGAPTTGPPPEIDFPPLRLARYYESLAPAALPDHEPWPEPGSGPLHFSRHPLHSGSTIGRPLVANVAFLDLGGQGAPDVVAAEMSAGLVLGADLDDGGGLERLARIPHPGHIEPVDLDGDGRRDLIAADLGGVPPGDYLKGGAVWLRGQPDGSFLSVTLADQLPRVADAQAADFDQDGDLDLVLAAFGWRWVGGVYLLENRTREWDRPSFVLRELDPRPGAIHTPVADLNGDGRPDFVALIAQQHETVVAFLNDGAGGFATRTVDTAPHPAWGSSGLSLVDLDRDGDIDALVTNGDMLDDFTVKPYHGIRWLENRGGFPWASHQLAGLPGVARARAADLDGDGDQDVVACAYVPPRDPGASDPDTGTPSVVWLEQSAPGRFERHTLERGGGHVSLDVADYDRDGDADLVVGNFRGPGQHSLEVWENLGASAAARGEISGLRRAARPSKPQEDIVR